MWAQLGDIPAWADLVADIERIDRVDDTEVLGVGSRFVVHRIEIARAVYEITWWEPNVGFTWETAHPWSTAAETYRLEPDGPDSCSLTIEASLAGRMGWAVWLIEGKAARRMARSRAATFARLAAGGGDDTGRKGRSAP